ncbi:MAG: head-tail connector protein [Hyphomicrobium sp.]
MPLILISGPAVEPVTAAEAKAHLRVDGSAEDVLIQSLILTSRLHIEAALGLALVTQSWMLILDAWPKTPSVALPLRPVQSITSVKVLAADGTPATLPASDYVLEGKGLPPRLVRTGQGWPLPGRVAAGIEIDFVAGFGPLAADVPEPIRHALLMLIAHWYERRDPLEIGSAEANIPPSVSDLLMPYRVPRL